MGHTGIHKDARRSDLHRGRQSGFARIPCVEHDGYADCLRTVFDSAVTAVEKLIGHFFEIIDPYSTKSHARNTAREYTAETPSISLRPAHKRQRQSSRRGYCRSPAMC